MVVSLQKGFTIVFKFLWSVDCSLLILYVFGENNFLSLKCIINVGHEKLKVVNNILRSNLFSFKH